MGDNSSAIMQDHVAGYEIYAPDLIPSLRALVPMRAPVDAEIAARVATIYHRDYEILRYDQP